jgi:predicted RNA-binding protein (TIGR00451 family)
MGAIKFVTNGADVMRPGITEIDPEIKKDEIICVIDEKHSKPLAICKTLFDSKEIQEKKEGKVLKNLHWIGDNKWKNSK